METLPVDNVFDDRMTELEREIDSLDIADDAMAALRQLAEDTRRRHASIKWSADAGLETAMKLEVQVGKLLGQLGLLREQAGRLMTAAEDASLAAKYAEFNREARERELRGEGRDHPEDNNGGS